MASLPIFKDSNKNFMMHQTSWSAAILPTLNNEINQGILLENIALTAGINTINHLLGRKQIGWQISDIDANASMYRSQPLNDKTLTLTVSAPCNVALWVF